MRKIHLILALSVFLVRCVLGQSPCAVKPGGHTVVVPLQNQPNSFEPSCQPARIRVNDRGVVTISLTGVSPTEVCLPSSKPATITTVVNPLEPLFFPWHSLISESSLLF
jgi:hypothetical protein